MFPSMSKCCRLRRPSVPLWDGLALSSGYGALGVFPNSMLYYDLVFHLRRAPRALVGISSSFSEGNLCVCVSATSSTLQQVFESWSLSLKCPGLVGIVVDLCRSTRRCKARCACSRVQRCDWSAQQSPGKCHWVAQRAARLACMSSCADCASFFCVPMVAPHRRRVHSGVGHRWGQPRRARHRESAPCMHSPSREAAPCWEACCSASSARFMLCCVCVCILSRVICS